MEEFPIQNARPLAPLTFSERIYLYKNKIEFKILLVTLAVATIGGYLLVSGLDSNTDEKSVAPTFVTATTKEPDEPKLSVYITGSVASPGVYELPKGSRVVDVLELAGNVTSQADLTGCNLAQKLSDSMMIVIPPSSGNTDNTCSNVSTERSGPSGSSSENQRINLNSATESELDALPGVGPATAKAIITYREKTEFKTINDLRKVKGIGEKKFADIKDLIDV